MTQRQRVVVTGLGAVSGYGWSAADLWQGLLAGRSAIGKPVRFCTHGQRTHLAAEVPPMPSALVRDPRWSLADSYAVAASREAVGSRQLEAARLGVFFGGSTAGMLEAEGYVASMMGRRAARPRLRTLRSQTLNGPGDAVARALGVFGPVCSVSSACASGALAIGLAADALRDGEVDAALCGGADSLCALTYSGFNALRAIDSGACRPFRRDRGGLSLGEGAGVLLLETMDSARRGGATVHAELCGSGASCDAHHMTAPHPDGEGAAIAMRRALADAALEPRDISFVNAHGTGTPLNDASESRALLSVFGERAARLAVTSTKSAVGHLLGAAGALEAVATVLCLASRQVHPTFGDGEVDPEAQVDLVLGAPRTLPAQSRALSTSFAFGGANAALVLATAETVP